MVATPYMEKQIRNYKTGKNKIRDKKSKAQQSKTYHVFEAALAAKIWWKAQQACDQKGSDGQTNPPKEILSRVKRTIS